jgi:hypothetical protein
VSDGWTAFALENSGHHLMPEAVVGKVLWELDPGSRALYGPLLSVVRTGQRPIVVPFRCDSPARRRWLQMELLPMAGAAVQFRSRTLRSSARRPVALIDLKTPRSAQLIVMCSWCKAVQVGTAWLEVEAAMQRLRLLEQRVLPHVTHGICPACVTTVMRAATDEAVPEELRS